MTDHENLTVRVSNSDTNQITVKFRQLNVDSEADYCHRRKDYLRDENLKQLAENIAVEGLQTPLLLKEAGPDSNGEMQYAILGGHRRFGAISLAMKRKFDIGRINESMDIPAILVSRDSEQNEIEFAQDLMVKSIGDNSNRRDLTEDERLRIVKKCREMGVPDPRAASALGLSESQYRRLAAVIETDWLLEMVKEKKIGMSHAANLIMACKTRRQIEKLHVGLERWITKMEPILEQERANAQKLERNLTGSANSIKKYLNGKLVKHWLRCIEEDTDLDDTSDFNFGVLVDSEKGTLTVPAVTVNIREHRRNDLVKVISELRTGAQQSLRLLKQMELFQSANDLSAEEESRLMQEVSNEYETVQAKRVIAEKGRQPTEIVSSVSEELSDLDLDDEQQIVESDSVAADSRREA